MTTREEKLPCLVGNGDYLNIKFWEDGDVTLQVHEGWSNRRINVVLNKDELIAALVGPVISMPESALPSSTARADAVASDQFLKGRRAGFAAGEAEARRAMRVALGLEAGDDD